MIRCFPPLPISLGPLSMSSYRAAYRLPPWMRQPTTHVSKGSVEGVSSAVEFPAYIRAVRSGEDLA